MAISHAANTPVQGPAELRREKKEQTKPNQKTVKHLPAFVMAGEEGPCRWTLARWGWEGEPRLSSTR